MRNRISHGYFSIDFEIIWQTIKQDLPTLEEQIQNIYKKIVIQPYQYLRTCDIHPLNAPAFPIVHL